MKKSHIFFCTCVAAVISVPVIAAEAQQPVGIALRYVTAPYALTAIKEHLGPTAAKAVSSVEPKRNTIALDATHAEAAVVRAFLTGLDQQPLQVSVNATVTRISEPGTLAARAEVLSRRTIHGGTVRPVILDVPEGRGSVQVALEVVQMGK